MQWEMQYPGEEDFLTVLADLKIFLSVEVKCHMNMKEKEAQKSKNASSKEVPHIDNNLQSASHQLRKNAAQMSKLHAPILSKGWRFVKELFKKKESLLWSS